jgi:hypothetical protein
MRVLLLVYQPYRPLPDFRGERLTQLPTSLFVSCHAPNLSKREPPSNPAHFISAARSLEEGLDETLTLHRFDVLTKLGISFKTTNLIESVMARVEAKTHRITPSRTTDQKHRWCAATLLEIEKQFRKVKGHQHVGLVRAALHGKVSSPLALA